MQYVVRPWGTYAVLYDGPDCKVKRIIINPGHRLSLQSHAKRAEHWVIVSGGGRVEIGDTVSVVSCDDKVYVPVHSRHRIACISDHPLVFIETQLGVYFGEDDIIRYQDDYGRS